MVTNIDFLLSVKNHSHKIELKADIKGNMQKTGDLSIILNGMDVNMDNYPSRSYVLNGVANGKNPGVKILIDEHMYTKPFLHKTLHKSIA